MISLAVALSFAQQPKFRLSDLHPTVSQFANPAYMQASVDRFIAIVYKNQVNRSSPLELDRSAGFGMWSCDISNGKRLTWFENSRVSIWEPSQIRGNSQPNLRPTIPNHRSTLKQELREALDIPLGWQDIEEPAICDFPLVDSSRESIRLGILPKGYHYPHPTKFLSCTFDEQTGLVKSLLLADSGVVDTRVSVSWIDAIGTAFEFIWSLNDPKSEPYWDQMGLGFQTNEHVTNARPVYVFPFRFRHVVYVDAKTGAISGFTTFK